MKRFCALVFLLFTVGACSPLPFEPSGSSNRKDPGTVVVRVATPAGTPIANVWVYIELPNSVGSTFWEGTATKADGTVTHRYIPAGRRTLEVKPPAGYTVDGAARLEIDVVKDGTVNAQFTLRPPTP